MSWDSSTAPIAAPTTAAAPGAPLQVVLPAMCWAAIVDTVDAAMCPVLPSATPATSDQCVRRRSRSRVDGGRSRAAAVIRGGYGGGLGSDAGGGAEAERQNLDGDVRLGPGDGRDDRATGQLGKATERVGEAHLFGRSCPDAKQVG